MESLKKVIEEIIPNLTAEQKKWIHYLKQHPDVKQILQQEAIPDESLVTSLNLLYQYTEDKENCNHCPGIEKCPNILKGHYTFIQYTQQQFQSYLQKCNKLMRKEEEEYRRKLFRSMYIPHDLKNVTFKKIDQTPGRKDALRALLKFCTDIQPNGKSQKGIYLYGPLGVGKSHLLAATANKLAERGISTLMVYVPDFFREMKSSIQDNSIDAKIEQLKNVHVLILDDLGAETISQWERDEILGAILQGRMVNGLPTLYTSNLNYDDLEAHLSYSNKGGEEGLKAMRLMERIRHYSDAYFVDGPNRRMSK